MNEKRQVRKPHKRRMDRLHVAALLGIGIVVLLVLALVMRGATSSSPKSGGEGGSGFFGVKSITVVGNTRYNEADVIKESGLYIGKNIWSVDKTKAVNSILAAFSYVETASISNTSYDRLVITVEETEELGAMYAAGKWVVVGTNNKILQTLEVTGDIPPRYRYFKGAAPYPHEGGTDISIGKFAMEDSCFKLVREMEEALLAYNLSGVGVVDVTERGGLCMEWEGRITVKLGGESNLMHKIGMVASSLPYIEREHGAAAAGTLDVSFQADGKSGEMGVFKPAREE